MYIMSNKAFLKLYNRSDNARKIINANNALWKRYVTARVLSESTNKNLTRTKIALRHDLSRGNVSKSQYNKTITLYNKELARRKKEANQLARKTLNQWTFSTGLARIRRKYP